MITRNITATIEDLAAGYPAIVITGPRQSGKTTLAKAMFPEKPYLSLESPDTRLLAQEDPRAFLNKYRTGAVFDEVQRVPELFSYLQETIDEDMAMGKFILTGSQQFGMFTGISQSLAGRAAMVQLLPFAFDEIDDGRWTLDRILSTGLYPPVHDRNLNPSIWYANYMQTYIERDIRQLINVKDLHTFQRFVKLCAGRSGQLLNLSQLAMDTGITHNTAKSWISLLEASYILFILRPHHRNFNKRIIKTPKLYFFDTGLVSWLLGIRNAVQMETHPLRGAIFETWIISEFVKRRFNRGLQSNLLFWRDREGHEVDLIIDNGTNLLPVEIKSGQSINRDYFKGLEYWKTLANMPGRSWCIYGGAKDESVGNTTVLSWQSLDHFPE